MLDFDLIPADYRTVTRARRWVRQWGLAMVAVIVCIVAGKTYLAVQTHQITQQTEQFKAEANELAAVKRDLAQSRQTERLERFRYQIYQSARAIPPGVSVLQLLNRTMDDAVWLDRLHYRQVRTGFDKPVNDSPAGSLVVGSPVANEKTWRFTAHLELTGHALNHEGLSRFIQNLEHDDAVALAQLTRNTLKQSERGNVIDYELSIYLRQEAPT